MPLTQINRRRLRTLGIITIIAAVVGGIYGGAISYILSNDAEAVASNIVNGVLRGIFTGPLIGGGIGAFELFVVSGWLRRLPFLPLILVKGAVYAGLILGGDWLGSKIFEVAGDPGFGANPATTVTFIFSMLFATVFNFVMEIALLLGPGVLGAMLRGRYHHPRAERRLFVFFDMRGSTQVAEQLGDLQFHRLLNRFFADLTEPVLAWRGLIHKYVGDEMIVTWPLDNGSPSPGAFQAVADARRRFAELADSYRRDFGLAPDFRAILHAGDVVTGEMGEVKREIVLLGAAINTTAKIEQISKAMPYDIVASAEAMAVAPLASGQTAKALGLFDLPGRSAAISLHAIA